MLMTYIEASATLRLRPSHLLLMIYRYLSGVYQMGDLFALNYIKGFLDGNSAEPKSKKILTVSGHGIGEAETWLAKRVTGCEIDTISFRLVDTQLLQFLRAAEVNDIEAVFLKFAQMVAPYQMLSELVSDPGLVPYWCDQAAEIKHYFHQRKIRIFSDYPLCINPQYYYDLIYISHGMEYFSVEAAEKLSRLLASGGWLTILMPSKDHSTNGKPSLSTRFANTAPVQEAKALFRKLLQARGYILAREAVPNIDFSAVATRCELSRFRVLASANSVLLGELILSSLGEHISDRARLEVLNETAAQFKELRMPVNEELELYIMEAKS
jgi:SAM-dependent methyltransferase